MSSIVAMPLDDPLTPADLHPDAAWMAEDVLKEIFFPLRPWWKSMRRNTFHWEGYLGMMPGEGADGFGGIVQLGALRIAAKSSLAGWNFSLLYTDTSYNNPTWRWDTMFDNSVSFRRARCQLAYARCWTAIAQGKVKPKAH